jgi:protein TonB
LFTLLYSFEDTYTTPPKTQNSTQNVKFTLINLPKQVEKPKVEKKVHVKKELKPQPKKIVKKIEKKVIKKINPKKIVKKIEPLVKPKKIVKKQIEKPIKKITEQIVANQIKKNKSIVKKQTVQTDTKQLQVKQNKYYAQIKQTIDKNKSYPKVAVRRGIQGDVLIQFTISRTGELLSFKILDGKKIFFKSIHEAVKNSFPLCPPKDLFTSNLDLKLTLQYKLY